MVFGIWHAASSPGLEGAFRTIFAARALRKKPLIMQNIFAPLKDDASAYRYIFAMLSTTRRILRICWRNSSHSPPPANAVWLNNGGRDRDHRTRTLHSAPPGYHRSRCLVRTAPLRAATRGAIRCMVLHCARLRRRAPAHAARNHRKIASVHFCKSTWVRFLFMSLCSRKHRRNIWRALRVAMLRRGAPSYMLNNVK